MAIVDRIKFYGKLITLLLQQFNAPKAVILAKAGIQGNTLDSGSSPDTILPG